jgi:hypothetical protein
VYRAWQMPLQPDAYDLKRQWLRRILCDHTSGWRKKSI